jgi:hypothetical protein
MSTLCTLGSLNAPPGQPGATSVQYILCAIVGGFLDVESSSDANNALMMTGTVPFSDPSGSIGNPDWPYKPAIDTPQTVILARRYFPAATPPGWFRDPLPAVCPAGSSIRVSAAEYLALVTSGGLQLF